MTHPLSEAGTSVEVTDKMVEAALSCRPFGSKTAADAMNVFNAGHKDWMKSVLQAGLSALIQPTPAETEGEPFAWYWEATDGQSAWPVWSMQSERPKHAPDRAVPVYLRPTPPPAETEGGWQRGEQEMFVKWLPKLIATLATKPAHVDDVARLARLHELLASPTPPPIGDGEGDLVARLRAAVDIGTRTGARGQHASNIYNLADEAVTAIEALVRERDEARVSRDKFWDQLVEEFFPLRSQAAAAEAQVSTLSRQLEEAREAERKRAIAAIHWVFSADGTKTERSMADEAINKINDPDFAPRRP